MTSIGFCGRCEFVQESFHVWEVLRYSTLKEVQ